VRDTPARLADAEPAVLIHGLGGSSQNWTDLADLLADRLDAQAIDLPGFGRSDPARSYSVAAQAHGVARWIEHSNRGPVHLLGNSMGGAVAVRLAATRPELVRTLTLISPAMPFLDPRRSLHGQFVPLLWLPGVDRLAARQFAALSPPVMARSMIETCFGEPARFSAQRLDEAVEEAQLRYAAPWYANAYVRSLRGLVRAFVRAYLPGSGSLWRVAGRITVPTLVIGGRRDRLIDPRVAEQVARVIPDSRLLMLDCVGHLAQMEVPRTVARGVFALLDEVSAQSEAAAAVQPALAYGDTHSRSRAASRAAPASSG
jgi:pimeloyl-ACP methyl ester carboxylesterase